MIDISNTTVLGLEPAIRGMRNPMNSWSKSDSGICRGGDFGIGCDNCSMSDTCHHPYDNQFYIGKADITLMERLAAGGSTHAKYRRMIVVYTDILAPLYWWKEFDTYKVGTVANSCSTMHMIHTKPFSLTDFSFDHLFAFSDHSFIQKDKYPMTILLNLIDALNVYREAFNNEKDPDIKKMYWWQMIQLLPSSYNQKRTVMLNYEVLSAMYKDRKDHKLDEWRAFCNWIKNYIPYSWLITGESKEE